MTDIDDLKQDGGVTFSNGLKNTDEKPPPTSIREFNKNAPASAVGLKPPIPEPIPEPTPEPIPEPIPEPTPEPISKPTPQPIPQATPEQTNNEEIRILNIAGEIVNLEGRANNSGRINSEQFKTMFTDNDEEITVLKKVFGIPTLRHTPQILTENGCSLDKKEAAIVRKILQTRLKNLEHGRSLLRGLPLASTYHKIRNYEFLIKKLSEFTDANKPSCTIPVAKLPSLPKVSLPKLPSLPKISLPLLPCKKDESVNKLLILVLQLLIGISSEKIRSQNVKDRLGPATIESILKSIKNNTVRSENVQNMLERVTQTIATSTPSSIVVEAQKTAAVLDPLSTITESTNDPTLRRSYEALMREFDSLTENYNKLSTDRTRLDAELKGKSGAITFLEKQLEIAKLKNSRRSESGDGSKIDRTEKATLEADIRTLQEDKLGLQKDLTDLGTRFSTIVERIKLIRDDIAAKKREVDTLFQAKQVELETEIRRKEEIIAQKEQLQTTLKERNESAAAVATEVADLREQLRLRTEELAAARATAGGAQEALDGLETDLQGRTELTTNRDESIVIAESTRLNDIITSLRKIYTKTQDPELLTQIEKLENATNTLDTSSVPEPQSDFTSRLSNILLQLALIDEVDDSKIPSLETPEQPHEPFNERLCILNYFINMLWSRIDDSIENNNISNNLSLKAINDSEVESKTLIKTIDKVYLPDLNNSDLWPVITQLGKVIAVIEREKGVVPKNANNLLKNIAEIETAQKAKDPSKYEYILKNIKTLGKNILPSGNKYIDPKNLEIKTKAEDNSKNSILEIPYLYLIEMRLLSRYIEYILENSPDRLECPSLPLGQATE